MSPTIEQVITHAFASASSVQKTLDRDQVSQILSALERLVSTSHGDHYAATKKLAALLEIMETLGYEFADEAAAGNALYQLTQFNILRGINNDK